MAYRIGVTFILLRSNQFPFSLLITFSVYALDTIYINFPGIAFTVTWVIPLRIIPLCLAAVAN